VSSDSEVPHYFTLSNSSATFKCISRATRISCHSSYELANFSYKIIDTEFELQMRVEFVSTNLYKNESVGTFEWKGDPYYQDQFPGNSTLTIHLIISSHEAA
jgi:hypothetical protein